MDFDSIQTISPLMISGLCCWLRDVFYLPLSFVFVFCFGFLVSVFETSSCSEGREIFSFVGTSSGNEAWEGTLNSLCLPP